LPTIQPVESPSVKVERVAFEAMVRRSFRVGWRVRLLVGVAFALVKTVQARRSTPSAPPEPAPWKPIVDEPVDEVGEPIEEPASRHEPSPDDTFVTGSEVSGLDVPLAPEPVKTVPKKAANASSTCSAMTNKNLQRLTGARMASGRARPIAHTYGHETDCLEPRATTGDQTTPQGNP
jgi:hypothetical protein